MHQVMLQRLQRQNREKLRHVVHLIRQLIHFLHRIDQSDMLYCLSQFFERRFQTVLCLLFRLDADLVGGVLLLHGRLVHAGHGHVA